MPPAEFEKPAITEAEKPRSMAGTQVPSTQEPAEQILEQVQEIPQEATPEPAPEIARAIAPVAGQPCSPDTPAVAKQRSAAAPAGMVYVPGGIFTMGVSTGAQGSDDMPAHNVCLSGFYIDRFEVTNAQFKEFVDATGYVTDAEKQGASESVRTWRHPYGPDSNFETMLDHPAICVSWNDANAYAGWIGKRLPTEAEWEKAARGTDGRIFPWGNTTPAGSIANVADKSFSAKWSAAGMDDSHKTAAPVGSFPTGKSVYGAEDMAGNVWEWCSDWWDSKYYMQSPPNNPVGPATGEYRIIRGGSWYYHLDGAKTTQRMYFRPDGSSAAIGFRCVLEVK